MCSLLRKKKNLSAMPGHLGRALASVKAGAARMQGSSRRKPRSGMPQMVAPEREWELLREVEEGARGYRGVQQELAHRHGALAVVLAHPPGQVAHDRRVQLQPAVEGLHTR